MGNYTCHPIILLITHTLASLCKVDEAISSLESTKHPTCMDNYKLRASIRRRKSGRCLLHTSKQANTWMEIIRDQLEAWSKSGACTCSASV